MTSPPDYCNPGGRGRARAAAAAAAPWGSSVVGRRRGWGGVGWVVAAGASEVSEVSEVSE